MHKNKLEKKSLIFFNPSIEGGGVEKNLFSLLNNINKKKYNVFFCTFNKEYKKKFKQLFSLSDKVKTIYPKKYYIKNNRLLKIIFCTISLIIFNYKKKIPIISFQGNIFAIIAAKITRSKIIIRCNTDPTKYINNYILKKIFIFFYKKADVIIVSTNEFKKSFENFFGLKCLVFKQTLNINLIKKKSKDKPKKKISNKNLKIISVGRLVDQKDHMTLLNALKILSTKIKVHLTLVGSGYKEKEILNYIEKNNLKKNFRLINFCQNPFPYIKSSDVFVLSSKYEGNPNILLETAVLKKLIISSDCKVGPAEILQNGKGGIIFKVGDYKKLAKILINLNIKSKYIKKKISNTYDFISHNYKINNSSEFIKILDQNNIK